MYTLIRAVSVRRLLLNQAPAIGGAMLIAEHFYKFHSFTLEVLAFLATWFVFDLVTSPIVNRLRRDAVAKAR